MRSTLRGLLQTRFLAVPGVFDPLTARLIESLGFQAVYLPGNALELHLCAGQPFVTLTETVDAARKIIGAIEVPLIVDAGAGFDEPAHVHRAVRELERAGVAALHIDDQPYPKRASYHRGDGGLSRTQDVVAKLQTAVAARRDSDLLIIARTDSLKVTGSLDEALTRCRACVDAGADALMVLGLGPDQAQAVRRAVPGTPLIWFTAPSLDPPTADVLENAGFSMALYPFNTVAAVAEAVSATWRAFAETGRPDTSAGTLLETAREVQSLIGMQTFWDIEARYKGKE